MCLLYKKTQLNAKWELALPWTFKMQQVNAFKDGICQLIWENYSLLKKIFQMMMFSFRRPFVQSVQKTWHCSQEYWNFYFQEIKVWILVVFISIPEKIENM